MQVCLLGFLSVLAILLTTTQGSGGDAMLLTSAAFKDGGKIGIQYVMPGAGGKNVSIPLAWQNAPPGTKSFALSIVDPHPVAKNWVHWLAINIPAQTAALAEGASKKTMPAGTVELRNYFGDTGYEEPATSGTGGHPPRSDPLQNRRGQARPAGQHNCTFNKALEGKTLASATVTGMYGR
jgi:Raf kinase inhibitor-like YbhB/YbcL family protein